MMARLFRMGKSHVAREGASSAGMESGWKKASEIELSRLQRGVHYFTRIGSHGEPKTIQQNNSAGRP